MRNNGSGLATPWLAIAGVCVLLSLSCGPKLLAHGGYHERIAELAAAVKAKPDDPRLHYELANLRGLHGELAEALKELDRVDALAPGQFLTDLARGEAFFAVHKFGKAKGALDREIRAHPEATRAWLLRARTEHELRDQAASVADYGEAFKRAKNPEPDMVQEVSNAFAENGRPVEASEVLQAGIEKLGPIPSLVVRAIELDISTKNYDSALHRNDEAQAHAPRPEPWMARRAKILARAGRPDESKAAWKALADHLDALPDAERHSNAMTTLREEARHELGAPESETH